MRKVVFHVILCFLLVVGFHHVASAQQIPPGYSGVSEYGFAVKKPVIGGACMACPWGAMANIVKAAMAPAGYDIIVCHTCDRNNSILSAAQHKLPPSRTPRQIAEGTPPPPYAPVDFGVSSPSNLRDAFLGVGAFKEGGPFKNLRLVAMIDQPSYLIVAVKVSSGITTLGDIKTARIPARIYASGPQADTILAYYGLSRRELESWGGSIYPPIAAAGAPADVAALPDNAGGRYPFQPIDFDVYIFSNAVMANNPESNMVNQASQRYALNFLQLPDELLNKLIQYPMERVVLPQAYFAGVDHDIATVGGSGSAIFVRDDAPERFSYDLAKAMDQHKDMLKWAVLPFSYNAATVTSVRDVPLAPGAARYYREIGYLK